MAVDEELKENRKERSFIRKIAAKPVLVILFILINVVVIAATASAEFGNSANAAELSEVKINWWLLIPAALCFLTAITCEIHKYVLMMKEMTPSKNKFDRT